MRKDKEKKEKDEGTEFKSMYMYITPCDKQREQEPQTEVTRDQRTHTKQEARSLFFSIDNLLSLLQIEINQSRGKVIEAF